MQALIVTPSPKPFESLLGYALRVSEDNGYASPGVVLKYAGLGEKEMNSACFSIKKLACVLNKPVSLLEPLSYKTKRKGGAHEFKILNHSLGSSVVSSFLRFGKPAVCLDCVSELGYIDAFWDISLAVACPFHKRAPLEICNECGKAITWFRQGLLICKCGSSFRQSDSPVQSESVIELMKILWSKLHNETLGLSGNPCGFNLDAFEKLTLKSFIELLDAVAKVSNTYCTLVEATSKLEVAEKVAHVFSNWPYNFRLFLDEIKTTQIKMLGPEISFSTCFRPIYAAIFHQKFDPEEVSFLRDEYDNYGLNNWDGSKLNAKINSEKSARFISVTELARKVGVRRVTITRLADKGKIHLKTIPVGGGNRHIVDTEQMKIPKSVDSNTMGIRAASALVGIPVRVLSYLKQAGHYSIENLFLHKDAYSEQDVLSFKAKLIATCEVLITELEPAQSLISFDQVMQRISFKSRYGKGQFVEAYLKRELLPAGKVGESLAQIFFHEQDVRAFSNRCKEEFSVENGILVLDKAAELIGIDLGGVYALIDGGLIAQSDDVKVYSLDRKSVEVFANEYVGLSTVANNLKTSSVRLSTLCRNASIDLLSLPRRCRGEVLFIKRGDSEKLCLEFNANPTRSKIRELNKLTHDDSVSKLKRFLDQLRANNQNLPMQGNKYHKTEIAKQCGFSRNTIYCHTELKKLLDDYSVEFNQRTNTCPLPSERLKMYIDQLKTSRSAPPLKSNGTLNKHTIAKICDFGRQMLYKDLKVIELLQSLENADKDQ